MVTLLPDWLNIFNYIYILVPVFGLVALLWLADQLFAPISAIEHGIVGFFGNRGTGKSFTAVTYARRWRRYHPNRPVWTNMAKLSLPGKGLIYLNADYDTIERARNGLVLIDEAGVWLNAWNFVNKDQRKIARFVAASRHMGLMILLTAHVPEHINKRVRDVMDELYFMQSFKGVKFFRAKVYESSVGVKMNKPSKTVYVPMWPTTCRSYDTLSLRTQADVEGVGMVGVDEDMPMQLGGQSDGEVTVAVSGKTIAAPATQETIMVRKKSSATKTREASEMESVWTKLRGDRKLCMLALATQAANGKRVP